DMALLGAGDDRALDLGRLQLHRRSSLMIKYLGFDQRSERLPTLPGRPNPLRDHRVREAFHLALHRDALTEPLPGYAGAARQPVPRPVFGFGASTAVARRDLPRARALLAQAGLSAGLELPLHTREILREAAPRVQGQLAEAGIRLTPQV